MRKDFGARTWLYPMPVLIVGTYDAEGRPDVMTAAWGGIHDTNQIGVCIATERKTAENLKLRKCFTVSIGDAAHAAECDYVGIVSANEDPDKVAKAGFHAEKAKHVDAPVIRELPMTLECRLVSYDDRTGCTVGDIVNVSADESILDEKGNIDPAKFTPLCFDQINNTYLKMEGVVGQAFRDGLKFK